MCTKLTFVKSKAFLFATVTWLHAPAEYCTVLLGYSRWFLWEIMSYSMCNKTNFLTPHPMAPSFIHRVDKHCLLPISPVTKKVKDRGLQRLSIRVDWKDESEVQSVHKSERWLCTRVTMGKWRVLKSQPIRTSLWAHGTGNRRFAVTAFHRRCWTWRPAVPRCSSSPEQRPSMQQQRINKSFTRLVPCFPG